MAGESTPPQHGGISHGRRPRGPIRPDHPGRRVLAWCLGLGRRGSAPPQAGHDVTALTLPGLESADADRSRVTLDDHVNAIVHAIRAADAPVVLAVHSAAGFSGYAASDRIPERIAAMVYVDTAPGKGALDPDYAGVERPLVWDELVAEENIDGLSETQLQTFRKRAVPEPGALIREVPS